MLLLKQLGSALGFMITALILQPLLSIGIVGTVTILSITNIVSSGKILRAENGIRDEMDQYLLTIVRNWVSNLKSIQICDCMDAVNSEWFDRLNQLQTQYNKIHQSTQFLRTNIIHSPEKQHQICLI